MFTRRETNMMEKGFYPSRCGRKAKNAATKEVLTGLGDISNRQNRRANFTGLHRKKTGILVVSKTFKIRSNVNVTPDGKKIMNWHVC